jgi:cyclopropane fatty-acyl-phospholipid synthase-like methyltransferase
MSHWRGRGRWADDRAWSAMGERHLAMFRDLCVLARHPRPVRTMLEWGPGGGPNAVAFAPEVDTFYGVDISAANLAECGRQLESAGFTSFSPVEIDAARPTDVLDAVPTQVDFVLSTAVFQHFPGKAYGVEVLNVMHRLLDSPGVALIQIRYDDGSEDLRPKDRDYAKNAVTFTSYRIDEFWQIARDAGFEPLSVVLAPATCYASYLLRKG